MMCPHRMNPCAACELRAAELDTLLALLNPPPRKPDPLGAARLWTLNREVREFERRSAA